MRASSTPSPRTRRQVKPGSTALRLLRATIRARWLRCRRSKDVQSAFAPGALPSHPSDDARYGAHRRIQVKCSPAGLPRTDWGVRISRCPLPTDGIEAMVARREGGEGGVMGDLISPDRSRPAIHKHVQVREYVRGLIQGADPGSPAPSERELVQHFGVARMTVRQALDALVSEGLLERVPGRGTFVARAKIDRS